MRILITGSQGFVGRHLVQELAEAGHEIVSLDIQPPADHVCDLCDAAGLRAILRSTRPDGCIHLAGLAFVPLGWEEPARMIQVNLTGTVHLLEACRHESPATRLLVVSSATAYGPLAGKAQVTEEAPLRPTDIYGISKMAADLTTLRYAAHHGLAFMTARPINHIGPGQSPNFVVASFAHQLKEIAAGRAAPHMSVGNLESMRDFVDVRDVVRAYRLLLEKGQAGEAYNIATGNLVKIGDMLGKLMDVAGVHPAVAVNPELYRPKDSSPRMDIAKIKAATGWEPRIPLEQTLRDIYQRA